MKIGVDLVEVKRFENFDSNSRLAENIFTPQELKDCQKKKDRAQSLAGRFAAKEAVRKTISENVKFNEVEIISGRSGALSVRFLDKKLDKKYKSEVSISHVKDLAQAACITCKK